MSHPIETVFCPCGGNNGPAIKVYRGVVSVCQCGRSYTAYACPGCDRSVGHGPACPVLEATIRRAEKGEVES